MGKMLDLTGQRFGRLTVLKQLEKRHNHYFWECMCDCGNTKNIRGASLVSGVTSCGCLAKEKSKAVLDKFWKGSPTHPAFKHGLSKSPTYRIWNGMIQRCHNESCPNYRFYGAKGTSVCDSWRESFAQFLQDVGERPTKNHSLERLDGKLGYSPGNVVWADRDTQARNRAKFGRNTSGKTGVYLRVETGGGDPLSWRAEATHPLTRERVAKNFSIKRFGYDSAYALACRARDDMIAEFNELGAGYSERHGE